MAESVSMEVQCRPLKIPKLNKRDCEGSKPSYKQLKLGKTEDDEYLRQLLLFHYQFEKSQGFTVDWEKLDYAFNIRSLDNSPPICNKRSNAEIVHELTLIAIERHNQAHGTKLVFAEHVSANLEFAAGLRCWLTFWAIDTAALVPESKIYQAKVWRRGKLFHMERFRLKPKDEEFDCIEVEPPSPMPYYDDDDYEKPPVVFLRAGPGEDGALPGVPFVFVRSSLA